MCGIFGIVGLNKSLSLSPRQAELALAAMRHRGPDGMGWQIFGQRALLGHVRLAILDLTPDSDQPMSAARGRYWITYNGELYNYVELRKELESLGVRFRSRGDTEVVLRSWMQWGEECVEKFNGMWAFAIYDSHTGELFCSRDRFGVKPFYYVVDGERLLLASEIKAILAVAPHLAEPEYNVIANFLRNSLGAQAEQTWFRSIRRLLPGHNMTLRNGVIRTYRYWHYPTERRPSPDFNEAKEEYKALFLDAVKLRMRSDVPVGVSLSAGIDSTSVAYAMHAASASTHDAFTSVYGGKVKLSTDIYAGLTETDESVVAQQTAEALGFRFHPVLTVHDSVIDTLLKAVWHLESGHASPAIVPVMQLMQAASRHVKVILEGQGSDELLAGYTTNLVLAHVRDLVLQGRVERARRVLQDYRNSYTIGHAVKMFLRYFAQRADFLTAAYHRRMGIGELWGEAVRQYRRLPDCPPYERRSAGLASRMLLCQHSGGLVNLLHYGDALSMAHGLEGRLPFMDYRLVEFVFSLPMEYKLDGAIGKYIHREAMRGMVPNDILDQRYKFGYVTPVGEWFAESGDSLAELLTDTRAAERGIFRPAVLQRMLREHRAGQRLHTHILYRLATCEAWFRNFMDNGPSTWKIAV